jgi:hypothetical protein
LDRQPTAQNEFNRCPPELVLNLVPARSSASNISAGFFQKPITAPKEDFTLAQKHLSDDRVGNLAAASSKVESETQVNTSAMIED